eukprot:jgi/Undpi1/8931/HiC_scaffold_26.g11392.m1
MSRKDFNNSNKSREVDSQPQIFGMTSGWMVSATESFNIAFVIDDIAHTFELDSITKGIVGGSGFLGMLFGAIFWSVYADKHGRQGAFLLSLICFVVAGFATALAWSANSMIVLRTIVGFGFLPTSQRGTVICRVIGVILGMGIVLLAVVGLALSRALGPGREEEMWRCILGFSTVPGVTVLGFVACGLLPESPRFLSFVGKHRDAVDIIEEIARVNGVSNVLGVELSQLTTEEEPEKGEHAAAGGVWELFQTQTSRRATVSVWTIWFFLHTRCEGAFSAQWACTEDRLGRVGTMKWSSWSTVVLLLIMAATVDTTPLLLPVSMLTYFIIAVPMIMTFVVTPELYSTKNRVVALAGANVLSRIGGLLAPILAEVLYEKGPVWPLAAFVPSMALVAIASGLIPFETAGRKLEDVTSSNGSEQVP